MTDLPHTSPKVLKKAAEYWEREYHGVAKELNERCIQVETLHNELDALKAERDAVEKERDEFHADACLWELKATQHEAKLISAWQERDLALKEVEAFRSSLAETSGKFLVALKEVEALRVANAGLQTEIERLWEAFAVRTWTEEERDGMSAAFQNAQQKHGHYETLFAVAAFILRHRARALLERR